MAELIARSRTSVAETQDIVRSEQRSRPSSSDGITQQHEVPVTVTGLAAGAIAVTAGARHAYALLVTGAVQCWGRNVHGEPGDGTITQRNKPVDVVLGGPASAVSAGVDHTCAIVSGSVRCWGSNSAAQLGDGTKTQHETPVDVGSLGAPAVWISAAGAHTCAVIQTGIVRCWGSNTWGQLGDGTTTSSLVPVTALYIP